MSTIAKENIEPKAQLLTALAAHHRLLRSTFFVASTTYGLAISGAALVYTGTKMDACGVWGANHTTPWPCGWQALRTA